jgi:hypothetical protein
MNILYNVDFKERKLISIVGVPKQSKHQCDCCHVQYIHIEDSSENMPFLQIVKKIHGRKEATEIKINICRDCAINMPKLFEES